MFIENEFSDVGFFELVDHFYYIPNLKVLNIWCNNFGYDQYEELIKKLNINLSLLTINSIYFIFRR